MRPSGPRQNRRELKIDARSVEVPFHPSWLTRQSREMRDIRQETGRQVGPQRVPVLLFQHVRYKYFSICCLTSCQQGSGKFLSIRTKRIATPWRSDSGTTVSPVEREKRIDKKGGGPSFLVARYICRSNGPTWGRPASCHANIPRKYSTFREMTAFFRFDPSNSISRGLTLNASTDHETRFDDSLWGRDLSLDPFSRLEITLSENKLLNYLFGTICVDRSLFDKV